MKPNLDNLKRKYPNTTVSGTRIKICMTPSQAGVSIYMDGGIWRIQPAFIQALTLEVLAALGLTVGTPQASQLRNRVVVGPDHTFIFEFAHRDISS